MYILSERTTWAKKVVLYFEKRFPNISKKAKDINGKVEKYFLNLAP